MGKITKVTVLIASALSFLIAGASQAQAEQFTVTVTPNQTYVDFPVLGLGGDYQIDLTRSTDTDPALQLYRGSAPSTLNTTSDPNPDNHIAEDDDSGPGVDSRLSGTIDSDYYTIRVTSYCVWDNDCAAQTETYTLTYTGLLSYLRTGNALRVDSAGVTTEKNNVVSCTPGKYTFLNGGSTAETAMIQSFVYTLLINGKAVSTLSSDNFKSVPSHLFPTIAGNMAGTATLDGATWDLKGMSNYSAACQVYATQSSGNVQSVTTGTHDSVALAAAAEAAAAAQKAKDMIANWATSNEELAKKYRDNRLAGKP